MELRKIYFERDGIFFLVCTNREFGTVFGRKLLLRNPASRVYNLKTVFQHACSKRVFVF